MCTKHTDICMSNVSRFKWLWIKTDSLWCFRAGSYPPLSASLCDFWHFPSPFLTQWHKSRGSVAPDAFCLSCLNCTGLSCLRGPWKEVHTSPADSVHPERPLLGQGPPRSPLPVFRVSSNAWLKTESGRIFSLHSCDTLCHLGPEPVLLMPRASWNHYERSCCPQLLIPVATIRSLRWLGSILLYPLTPTCLLYCCSFPF